MIDSHCHLADDVFAPQLPEVIDRARAAGLERALVILEAGNQQEAAQASQVEALWPEVRVSIGVHPHHASRYAANPAAAPDIVRSQIAATPSARAVGEIGLDYHYDYAPRDLQQEIFRSQVQLARSLSLPIVIHTREADDDTLAILREEGGGALRGVLHCFTGNAALARAGLDLGLHISFAGIITFPKSADLRDVARLVPLDRLLTETDSPFLAPVPHRGKRNEPAYVERIVAVLADVHQIPPPEVARRTAANFHSLFRP